MSGGIEAAGDIATGMFIGRAVEPRAGEGVSGADGHGLCLNCGTALIGDFCHACGQSEHVHRTLSSIGHDLLHGVFHFEGKVWRTWPMLLLHPGALTRRYISGERARFVSPLALFLFSVFLMFAVINSVSGSEFETGEMTPAQRQKSIAAIDTKIVATSAEVNRLQAIGKRSAAEDGQYVAKREVLDRLFEAKREMGKVGSGKVTFSTFKTGWHLLDKGVEKANKNPGLAIYKLQSSAYKYSWALIPISVPFVALLFLWRRRFKLYDHAIFVTYSLAFMMLGVTALSLAGAIGAPDGLIVLAVFVVPPVHMFAQLRGAYELRKRSALWRTVLLLVFAGIALMAFFTLLLALGLFE